eukprot:2125291-Pyramimonas_sp.AAC.1
MGVEQSADFGRSVRRRGRGRDRDAAGPCPRVRQQGGPLVHADVRGCLRGWVLRRPDLGPPWPVHQDLGGRIGSSHVRCGVQERHRL